MSTKDLVIALIVVTVWGANFTVIRLGLEGVPPLLLVSLRFSLAVFPAILIIKRPEIKLYHLLTYGFSVGIGQFVCLFYAIHLGMPAGVASVVLQSQAFFTMLFAYMLLGESFSCRQIVGLILAAAGLYLVAGGAVKSPAIPLGALLLTLMGAAFWGISNIVVRHATMAAAAQGKKINMLSLVVWSSLVPPVPLFLLSLLVDSPETVFHTVTHLNALSLFSIAYLAFGATILGYGLWSYLLGKYQANRVAPLSLLIPVAGLITAQVVLGEHLLLIQWAGCLLVVAGLLAAFFTFPRKKRL
jgi:O-acetylserine/cysteine efflux transporter